MELKTPKAMPDKMSGHIESGAYSHQRSQDVGVCSNSKSSWPIREISLPVTISVAELRSLLAPLPHLSAELGRGARGAQWCCLCPGWETGP
jgi:hypothetical protein